MQNSPPPFKNKSVNLQKVCDEHNLKEIGNGDIHGEPFRVLGNSEQQNPEIIKKHIYESYQKGLS